MKYFAAICSLLLFISCHSNDYNVHIDDNIRKELVVIQVYSTVSDPNQIVYLHGKSNPDITYYGENDWSVIYDGDEIFKFREFVLNRNQVAKYDFYLSKINAAIVVEMWIDDAVVNC